MIASENVAHSSNLWHRKLLFPFSFKELKVISDIVMSSYYKTETEICIVSVYISQADKWLL